MRNLHHERIYYETPWFIELLRELNINVSPEQHKQPIRRFILGEKLTPMSYPERRDVRRSVEIPVSFEDSVSMSVFFSSAENALSTALTARGIDQSKITNIEAYTDESGNCMADITYMAPETDAELALRKASAEVFNKILLAKDEIYKRIDERTNRASKGS